jgi:hypothetical protein
MAGPYPPQYGAGPGGQGMYPPAQPYPENPVVPSAYPGMLPPPVQYPKRRRWRLVAAAILAIAVVAGLVAALVLVARTDNGGSAGEMTDAQAKTAIQDYLNALSDGDRETVARHALCGLFDDVKDRRSDLEVADLNSDAFRKQFTRVEVTNVDKMVFWSASQVQVLFTMRVVPANSRNQQPSDEEQGVAQLLHDGNEILVCNYLLRVAGQY